MPTDYSLQDIAEATNGEAVGQKEKRISGVAPFETGDSNQITFVGGSNYLKRIDDARAGAIFVPTGFKAPGKNLIGVSNPQLAFARVVDLFHPAVQPPSGISKMSATGSGLQTGDGVFIGAFVTVGDGVTIGSDSIIQNGVFIGDGVSIGEDSVIVAQVGIAGSTTIGHHAKLAGQAGIVRPPDHRQPCHRGPDDRGRQVDLRRRSRLIRLSIDAPQNLAEGSTRHSDFTGNEEKNCRPGKATR